MIVWQCEQGFDLPTHRLIHYFKAPVEIVLPDERHEIFGFTSRSAPSVRFQPIREIPSLAVFTFTLDFNLTVSQVSGVFNNYCLF